MWPMIAAAGVGTVTSLMQSKAKAEAMLADGELTENKFRIMRQRQTEAYNENISEINSKEISNALSIEKNKLQAESRLAGTFAGSGISGRSVDELSAEIASDVAADHNRNVRMADKQKAALFGQRQDQLEDMTIEASNRPEFDASDELLSAVLSGASSGMAIGGM